MSGGSRRRGPSCDPILTARCASAAGTASRRPIVDALAERFAAQGYVDDAAYALSKSRSLTGRGYGARRVEQSLRIAGVEEADAKPARDA